MVHSEMNQQARVFLTIGGISGLLAVALGAFGAHGLENKLTANLLETYSTGNVYHFYHTFALLAVGFAAYRTKGRLLMASGSCFIAGTLLFSGSLYVLAITGIGVLGAITPIGGVLLIVGWALFAAAVYNAAPRLNGI